MPAATRDRTSRFVARRKHLAGFQRKVAGRIRQEGGQADRLARRRVVPLVRRDQAIGQRLGLARAFGIVVIGIAPLGDIIVLHAVDGDVVEPAGTRERANVRNPVLAERRRHELDHHLAFRSVRSGSQGHHQQIFGRDDDPFVRGGLIDDLRRRGRRRRCLLREGGGGERKQRGEGNQRSRHRAWRATVRGKTKAPTCAL